MKRRNALIMLAALIGLVSIVSCTPSVKEVDVNEVFEKLNATGYLSSMIPVSRSDLYEVYGIETDKIEQAAFYLSENSSMNADEIAIFELADAEYADTLFTMLRSRIERKIRIAEEYSMEETAKIKKTEVCHVGNYVYYIVCDEYNELMKIMKENIG